MSPDSNRNSILIRPFDIDDHPAATTLWRATAGIGLSVSDTRENIAAYLERNPGMSFVAVGDNGVIGTVLCGTDGRRGYLHHLAVDPDYRGRGLARDLVARCLEAAAQAGLPKCHLFLYSANRSGRAFWEHIGWTFRSDLDVVSIDLMP